MPRRLNVNEIAADLEARIRDGEYPPGSELPSYSKLAELYSVHISSISRVMLVLRARGLVRSEPGRAVYVAEN